MDIVLPQPLIIRATIFTLIGDGVVIVTVTIIWVSLILLTVYLLILCLTLLRYYILL